MHLNYSANKAFKQLQFNIKTFFNSIRVIKKNLSFFQKKNPESHSLETCMGGWGVERSLKWGFLPGVLNKEKKSKKNSNKKKFGGFSIQKTFFFSIGKRQMG